MKSVLTGTLKAQDIAKKLDFLRIGDPPGMERKRMGARMRLKVGRNKIWRYKVKGKIRKSIEAKILTPPNSDGAKARTPNMHPNNRKANKESGRLFIPFTNTKRPLFNYHTKRLDWKANGVKHVFWKYVPVKYAAVPTDFEPFVPTLGIIRMLSRETFRSQRNLVPLLTSTALKSVEAIWYAHEIT